MAYTSYFSILRTHVCRRGFNCALEPRLDRSFVSLSGGHDFLALRRLPGQAQLSDVLKDDMELGRSAEE